MKRNTKYVGLDVHQAMTVATVRSEGGRVIARSVVETSDESMREFFSAMAGSVHVVFEEGTQAQWLYDLLSIPPVKIKAVVLSPPERIPDPGRGEPRRCASPLGLPLVLL